MSFAPPVSLVVVSRNRPEGIKRLIASLRFQTFQNFEVIVVSNYADIEFLADLPFASNIRHVFFDQANISAARNCGIEQSAGEIIAFCDDDAVPEPFWLDRLVAAFENPDVGSAGGYVRGRNGIDYQWKAIKCDQFGDDFPFDLVSEDAPQTFQFDGTYFVKVQGTNCAFRKSALDQIGGFDEGYRFFLDETDVSLSLAKRGWLTTVVPLAEVQHGFEESGERTRQRVPKTLANIGASKAYFIAKHAKDEGAESLDMFCRTQRNRLVGLMVGGYLNPGDVKRLMATLNVGLKMQINQQDRVSPNHPPTKPVFVLYQSEKADGPMQFIAIAGTTSKFRKLSQLAIALQSKNAAVTVFRFSYTALFHRRFFDVRGYWVQTGGLFGRSNRVGEIIRFQTLKNRLHFEVGSFSDQRPFKKLHIIRIFQKSGLFLPD